MKNSNKILRLLFWPALLATSLGLWSCDQYEEDVIPKSFADIRLHPDEIYIYRNSIIALKHFVNDTIPSYENITYSAPQHGKLTTYFDGEDKLAYKPAENFVGTDSITYQVCVGETCRTAKIKFIVEAPIPLTSDNCKIVLGADSIETTVNTPKEIRMFVNDTICTSTGGYQLQWDPPRKGTYKVYEYNGSGSASNKNMVFVYTPPKNYKGTDSFIYRVHYLENYPNDYLEMEIKIKIK